MFLAPISGIPRVNVLRRTDMNLSASASGCGFPFDVPRPHSFMWKCLSRETVELTELSRGVGGSQIPHHMSLHHVTASSFTKSAHPLSRAGHTSSGSACKLYGSHGARTYAGSHLKKSIGFSHCMLWSETLSELMLLLTPWRELSDWGMDLSVVPRVCRLIWGASISCKDSKRNSCQQ